MKTTYIIFLIIVTIYCAFATITESELNQYYEDCFDKNNHPSYEDYSNLYDYECDSNCKVLLDTFIQDLIDINSNQAVKPCDIWWAYQQSDEYDSNNIDGQQLFTYQECLLQMFYINQDYDQKLVIDCLDVKIGDYLIQNSILHEKPMEYEPILQQADINQCKSQCNVSIDCDEDCQAFINNNLNKEIGECDSIDFEKEEDDEMYRYKASQYLDCYQENLLEVDKFKEVRQQIDLNTLYDTATYNNNYTIDYSTLNNLEANQKAYLTLDCQMKCYDYYYQYGTDDYNFKYYDNRHAILEMYGEDKYDEAFYEYCSYYDDNTIFDMKSKFNYFYKYDLVSLDCLNCFDDNGNFLEGLNEEENSCDTDHCFVEFYECVDQCQEKHCYFDTCYDRNQKQSFNQSIQDYCIGFYNLNNYYENEELTDLLNVVTPEYLESYIDCIARLQAYEENNNERQETEKEQIFEFYTCLDSCSVEKPKIISTEEETTEETTEETVEETVEETIEETVEEQNENDGEGFQSRLILTLGSLILLSTLLV